jgi:hypothetical protein
MPYLRQGDTCQRAFYCDGPDCEGHVDPIAKPAPYLPYGFIEARQSDPAEEHHFCSWGCVMKFAADQPIPEGPFPLHGDADSGAT